MAAKNPPAPAPTLGQSFLRGLGAPLHGAATEHGQLVANAAKVGTIVGVAVGVHYFNRSRPTGTRPAWRAAELIAGGLGAASVGGLDTMGGRVLTGIVAGGLIGTLGASQDAVPTGGQVADTSMLAPQALAVTAPHAVKVRIRQRA